MKAYKLTDKNGQTHGGCQWGPNVSHEAVGNGPLCSASWIHVYDNSIKAVLLNPIHANFNEKTMKLWECEVSGQMLDDLGRKFGVQKCTTIKEIPVPVISLNRRIDIAIKCALAVYKEASFVQWANDCLSGKDRSKESAAAAAAAAARAAARAAAAAARAADADAYDAAAAYAARAAYAYAADADAAAAARAAAAAAAAYAAAAYDAAYDADLISKIIAE